MNYLVHLDARAGELEKILSGVKTMLVKEIDPEQPTTYPINPGDSLFFLKSQGDSAVRVKAIVARVLFYTNHGEGDLSHIMKEMQPKLQLTEDQYNHWAAKQQVLLVEFGSAHKIDLIQVASNRISDRSDWIAFEEFNLMTNSG